MVRKFRNKTVNGWQTIIATPEEYDEKVNALMDEFDFEDYQFGPCVVDNRIILVGSMLLRDKE